MIGLDVSDERSEMSVLSETGRESVVSTSSVVYWVARLFNYVESLGGFVDVRGLSR